MICWGRSRLDSPRRLFRTLQDFFIKKGAEDVINVNPLPECQKIILLGQREVSGKNGQKYALLDLMEPRPFEYIEELPMPEIYRKCP